MEQKENHVIKTMFWRQKEDNVIFSYPGGPVKKKAKILKAGLLGVNVHLLAIESMLSGHWLGFVHEDK